MTVCMYQCAALTPLPSVLWLGIPQVAWVTPGMAPVVIHMWTPLSRTASQVPERMLFSLGAHRSATQSVPAARRVYHWPGKCSWCTAQKFTYLAHTFFGRRMPVLL